MSYLRSPSLEILFHTETYYFLPGPAEQISKCEHFSVSQLEMSGSMLPRVNLRLNSSEIAKNGSKTSKNEVNF